MAQRPGSAGEHELQQRYDTFRRAAAFYDKQMLDHLNPLMREYIARQEMAFIATADAHGECDASFRAGPRGFVRMLDERTLMYPEYRGNGVLASLGNISENGHVGILFVDFFYSGVGLHVNGRARVVDADAVAAFEPILARIAGVAAIWDEVPDKKKTPERWVLVDVVEAYIHCSKHIPILRQLEDGAEDHRQSGDFFRAKHVARPWIAEEAGAAVAEEAVFEGESCSLIVDQPEREFEREREPQPQPQPEPAAAAVAPAGTQAAESAAELPPAPDSPPEQELQPAAESQQEPEPERQLEGIPPIAVVAGPEIAFADDDSGAEAAASNGANRELDELELLVPPPWGAYRS